MHSKVNGMLCIPREEFISWNDNSTSWVGQFGVVHPIDSTTIQAALVELREFRTILLQNNAGVYSLLVNTSTGLREVPIEVMLGSGIIGHV